MKWKALRKVFHNGAFVHPGQVIEADEKFDGCPHMEMVADPVVAKEPEAVTEEPVMPEEKAEPVKQEDSKGAE